MFLTGRFEYDRKGVERALLIAIFDRCGLKPTQYEFVDVPDVQLSNTTFHVHTHEEVERQARQMVSNQSMQVRTEPFVILDPAYCSC
jgi:hypothetical protein